LCIYFSSQKDSKPSKKIFSVANVLNLVAVTSQLVNEFRKERGISAEFISTNNADFTLEINNQREVTTST
jgi:hypothetical protein